MFGMVLNTPLSYRDSKNHMGRGEGGGGESNSIFLLDLQNKRRALNRIGKLVKKVGKEGCYIFFKYDVFIE